MIKLEVIECVDEIITVATIINDIATTDIIVGIQLLISSILIFFLF